MSVLPSVEPHIVVNSDRTITVPDELKSIAAQFDHNIETVVFDCPRFWDGNDFKDMSVYIIYMRGDDEPGMYECNDVTVDETDDKIMHFSWLISGDVTAVAGKISFLVSIKQTDEAGLLLKRWNSFRCNECTIRKGINVSDDLLF